MNDLSSQILKLRKAAGLTQEQLAEKLGVTPQSVSNWERRGAPDISMLPILAGFFGVTVDELMGRNPENTKLKKRRFWQKYYEITDREEQINLLIEEYRKYPHDCRVIINLMEKMPYERPENKLFIEELCNKILAESTEPWLRERALAYMCHILPAEKREKWLTQLTRRTYMRQHEMLPILCVQDGDYESAQWYWSLLAVIRMDEYLAAAYTDRAGPEMKARRMRKDIAVIESLGENGYIPLAWRCIYAYKILVLSACLFGCGKNDEGWVHFEKGIEMYLECIGFSPDARLDTGYDDIKLTYDRGHAVRPDGRLEYIGDCMNTRGWARPEYLKEYLTSPSWAWFDNVRNDTRFLAAVRQAQERLQKE